MSDKKREQLVKWFTEKLEKDEFDREKKKAEQLFDKIITHQQIREVSKDLFLGGKHRNAVLDAMIKIEEMVKEKAKRPKDNKGRELSGKTLMFRVFDLKEPILKWSDLQQQGEQDEHSGYCQIFAGAMLGIRNPKAHGTFRSRPMRALQLLHLATLLAERIDESKYVEQN